MLHWFAGHHTQLVRVGRLSATIRMFEERQNMIGQKYSIFYPMGCIYRRSNGRSEVGKVIKQHRGKMWSSRPSSIEQYPFVWGRVAPAMLRTRWQAGYTCVVASPISNRSCRVQPMDTTMKKAFCKAFDFEMSSLCKVAPLKVSHRQTALMYLRCSVSLRVMSVFIGKIV
jgi:hypothetical protein